MTAPDGPYALVYADPPWAYRTGRGVEGAVPYDTLDTAAVAAVPVGRWAAPDCLLACWGTWPHLADLADVVRAWGFEVVTGLPWVKALPDGRVRLGTGYWVRGASEFLVLARRGAARPPAPADRHPGLLVGPEQTFYHPPGRHSAKPPALLDWLATVAPPGPRLELWARAPTPGWTAWGTDLGFRLGPAGVAHCAPAAAPDLLAALP